jgi:hypothetical protein
VAKVVFVRPFFSATAIRVGVSATKRVQHGDSYHRCTVALSVTADPFTGFSFLDFIEFLEEFPKVIESARGHLQFINGLLFHVAVAKRHVITQQVKNLLAVELLLEFSALGSGHFLLPFLNVHILGPGVEHGFFIQLDGEWFEFRRIIALAGSNHHHLAAVLPVGGIVNLRAG